MTGPLKNLLILLCGIAVILLLVIVLFGGKSPVMRFLSIFLEEDDSVPHSRAGAERTKQRRTGAKRIGKQQGDSIDTIDATQKSSSETLYEMATLIQKSDDRLRVIENNGTIRLIDEYYELLFVTAKGQKLKVRCSPEVYEIIPFDEQGSLAYRKNTLVKFKLYDQTILEDGRIEENGTTAAAVHTSDDETTGL